MAKSTRPSAERLRTILSRQDPPGAGDRYVPSILATREEAPRCSRPSTLWWGRLKRRLHVLSTVERDVAVLCMHHPGIYEIQEQRMLPVEPAPHPLGACHGSDHPIGQPLQGTLDVAERLGLLKFHATIKIESAGGDSQVVPFPWVGDLLLFIADEKGRYATNLTIKHDTNAFGVTDYDRLIRRRPISAREIEKAEARHAIEQRLYLDAGIPTVRVTREDFPDQLATNLLRILGWHGRPTSITEEQRLELLEAFELALVKGLTPFEVIWSAAVRFRVPFDDAKSAVMQMIWRRDVRIDLFRPFLIDSAMYPEQQSPMDLCASWFRRI